MNALTIKKALISGVSALSLSVLAAPVAFAQTSGGTNTQNRPAAPAQTQQGQTQPAQTQNNTQSTQNQTTPNQATGKNNTTGGSGAAASGAAQTGAGTTTGVNSETAIVTGVVALVAAGAIAATRKRESYEA